VQQGKPKDVCESYLQAFYEAQQGVGSSTKLNPTKIVERKLPTKDQRLAFINNSNLRNDLKVFKFNPDSASFGKGGLVS